MARFHYETAEALARIFDVSERLGYVEHHFNNDHHLQSSAQGADSFYAKLVAGAAVGVSLERCDWRVLSAVCDNCVCFRVQHWLSASLRPFKLHDCSKSDNCICFVTQGLVPRRHVGT